jgi:hypothetical protein
MRLSQWALGIVVASAAASTGAQAQNYPWCAQYSGDLADAVNCGFISFDQCMATVRGMGGFCMVNNRYVPAPGPALQSGTHKTTSQ